MAEVMLVTWWIWHCEHCPTVYKHRDRSVCLSSARRHMDRMHNKTLVSTMGVPMKAIWAFNIVHAEAV